MPWVALFIYKDMRLREKVVNQLSVNVKQVKKCKWFFFPKHNSNRLEIHHIISQIKHRLETWT